MVNAKMKKLFIDFLSKQGITIEFSMALKPVYISIDDYLSDCIIRGTGGSDLISIAFKWESSEAGYAIWEYHNVIWNHCLQMEELCPGKME